MQERLRSLLSVVLYLPTRQVSIEKMSHCHEAHEPINPRFHPENSDAKKA